MADAAKKKPSAGVPPQVILWKTHILSKDLLPTQAIILKIVGLQNLQDRFLNLEMVLC